MVNERRRERFIEILEKAAIEFLKLEHYYTSQAIYEVLRPMYNNDDVMACLVAELLNMPTNLLDTLYEVTEVKRM